VALAVVVLLLVLPFLEVWVAVEVAGAVGFLLTVAALVAFSTLGVVVVRREGVVVWRRITAEVAAGRTPARELLDGGLLLLGGTLLALPGFVSASVGLLLLFPPVRAVLGPLVLRSARRRLARSGVSGAVFADGRPVGSRRSAIVDTGIVEAEIIDVEIDLPEELPPGRG
jgi:UPF0716 protein FxsA